MDSLLAAVKARKLDEEDECVVSGVADGSAVPTPVSGGAAMARGFRSPVQLLPFYTGHLVERSVSGFAGLSNQGATCYLNSMLQSLFMTPELREAVFQWRYDARLHPEAKRCIPLQLQNVFSKLQLSVRGAVSTMALTTSFGWTGRQVYVQHDVLELADVLFSHLETQAFGSRLEHVITELHKGQWEDYVQCLKCRNFRPKLFPFVGIGLDIADARCFDDAMKRYITPEILSGANQYYCEQCASKQDAKKGIRFTSFPYFMNVYFRRWTLNFMTMTRVKIAKKLPFPKQFDASVYLNSDGYLTPEFLTTKDTPATGTVVEAATTEEATADPSTTEAAAKKSPVEAQIYELYAIMMHSGGAMGGHYFAYIRDFDTDKWYEFNDSRVTEIPEEDFAEFWKTPEEVEAEEAAKKKAKEEKIAAAKKKREELEAQRKLDAETTDTAKSGDSADAETETSEAKVETETTETSTIETETTSVSGDEVGVKKTDTDEASEGVMVRAMGGIDVTAALKEALAKRGEIKERFKDATAPADYKPGASEPVPKRREPIKRTYANPMSGAYCLLYRLKDETRNVSVAQIKAEELLPKDIVDAIRSDDASFLEQKAKLDEAMKQVNVVVHWKERTESVVCLLEDTATHATEKIWKALELKEKEDVDLECVRLRKVKPGKWVPKQPLTGELADRTLTDLKFKNIEHLILESRPKDGEFPKFEPDKVSYRMIELDLDSMEYKEPVMVQVNEGGTLGDLRLAFALSLGILKADSLEDADAVIAAKMQVRIVLQQSTIAAMLSDDYALLKKSIQLKDGDTLHCERCENHLEGDSMLLRKFDEVLNVFDLRYNVPQTTAEASDMKLADALATEVSYDKYIRVDVRKPFGELRKRICAALEIGVDKCVFRLNPAGAELKDNNKTLEKLGLRVNGVVFVALGTPLNATEYRFEIFVEDEIYKKQMHALEAEEAAAVECAEDFDKKAMKKRKAELGDAFLLVGSVVLDSTWEMARVKQEINAKVEHMPDAKFMRLRQFTGTRLTKVYLDTCTLQKNTGRQIRDYMQLCVQRTATEEHFTKEHILLNVGRWYPSQMALGPFTEMALRKKTKIKSELKDILKQSIASAIPRAELQLVRAVPYMLKAGGREKICSLDWASLRLTEASTIAGRVWKCKSGDFILFKSDTEKELLSKEGRTAAAAAFLRREEVPLTFYTPEEQIAREKEAAAKKARSEADDARVLRDAAERLKAADSESAKKAAALLSVESEDTKKSTVEADT